MFHSADPSEWALAPWHDPCRTAGSFADVSVRELVVFVRKKTADEHRCETKLEDRRRRARNNKRKEKGPSGNKKCETRGASIDLTARDGEQQLVTPKPFFVSLSRGFVTGSK